MRLKLLAAAIPLLMAASGCTIHFPLSENKPSLASQDNSSGAGDMATARPNRTPTIW